MAGWGKSQKESEPAPVGSIIPLFHYSKDLLLKLYFG
jgi:hypothetical protein